MLEAAKAKKANAPGVRQGTMMIKKPSPPVVPREQANIGMGSKSNLGSKPLDTIDTNTDEAILKTPKLRAL